MLVRALTIIAETLPVPFRTCVKDIQAKLASAKV
jgi:hypothetical protein